MNIGDSVYDPATGYLGKIISAPPGTYYVSWARPTLYGCDYKTSLCLRSDLYPGDNVIPIVSGQAELSIIYHKAFQLEIK